MVPLTTSESRRKCNSAERLFRSCKTTHMTSGIKDWNNTCYPLRRNRPKTATIHILPRYHVQGVAKYASFVETYASFAEMYGSFACGHEGCI
mmetsp:Transcript_29749/g.47886  ORF Transcript_29749/g.47886 Transcript_29749/m.47886 type:complete len:92 (+) Transcript_29749:1488-1763(+)